ncbi:ABC transporter ATP-binding protein [Alicyclobacillus sp. SO9]|uniref:ABC transporter ATP-binding protein n=1 Tax=Alicyclobacillus sp. SO9 TaxID=2665646 RepID=UPI0018E706AE|nr:ABC transporter ATP-binding protein [Alicyclobacillus sp. SO9]QQE77894.1 ABC transporter ATP-binding protein [Alicyclobacillus sp. SO9]
MAQQRFIEVDNLKIRFPIRNERGKAYITPVDDVSFHINKGEVLSLVGESGSGKSTIGRALVRILEPSQGTISVGGQDVSHIRRAKLSDYRKTAQMVFQDPFGSLNPVRTLEKHLEFPLRKFRHGNSSQVSQQIDELFERVGLTPIDEFRNKFPHELSGGQRQRVAIARALAVNPSFIVADEPISMLDVSIRAGILELMSELQSDFDLSYLYITHDLASARYFGDRIMVMYGGRVMETASSRDLLKSPLHPYTRLMFAATPGSDWSKSLPETSNEAPDLSEGRVGCPFAHRCPYVKDDCRTETPALRELAAHHYAACHYAKELA